MAAPRRPRQVKQTWWVEGRAQTGDRHTSRSSTGAGEASGGWEAFVYSHQRGFGPAERPEEAAEGGPGDRANEGLGAGMLRAEP